MLLPEVPPDDVLNTIVPLVAEELAPLIIIFLIVLEVASLESSMVEPAVLVFVKVILWSVAPEVEPSIITLSAPFKLKSGPAKVPDNTIPGAVGFIVSV